ncbi:MAG: DUF4399 domain-containing protein [Caldilineaceae bacterium]
MNRTLYGKLIPLTITYLTLCLLLAIFVLPTWAAPLIQSTQQGQEGGQEYVVQTGDSLYKISGQFYDQPDAYQVIVEATNAKAANDSRFTRIIDPRRIFVGQRLWIPDDPSLPIVTATATSATQPLTTTQPSLPPTAPAQTTPGVHFVSPTDGATVSPTFMVEMAAAGLTVEPAGVINEGAGHFHILVDTDFVPAGEVIITDEQHLHFGKGQYTTTLELEPGEHVLRLQFANGAHIALAGEAYQDTITVTVAEDENAVLRVHFVSPTDGATVSPTFMVEMAAAGLTVEPAGVINEGAGHFHILVDTDFVPAGEVIITDEQHLHFGKGQYTTTLEPEPESMCCGCTCQRRSHCPGGEAYQDTITVTVAEDENAEPRVHFVSPTDGATVSPTFMVEMAATGLTVEPAGVINEGAGHFHILVDTDFVPAGEVIITDEQHLHFGKGQYTTTLELEPGEHVLRLQFANGAHIALAGEAYQDTITVTVAEDENAGPRVHFVSPTDGATVSPTFMVEMAAAGLTVEPAGVINEGAGHFHILVDTDFVPAGEVIITDEQHLHFGKGQYTTTLELEPGEHVLRLQFANGAHIALAGEAYHDEIIVTVE